MPFQKKLNPYDKAVHVRMLPQLRQKVRQTAQKVGLTESEFIRRGIKELIEKLEAAEEA